MGPDALDNLEEQDNDRAVPPHQVRESPWWARHLELLVALGVVAMGVVILIDTQDIRVPKAFASVGPRVFPTIVGWGLVGIGIWYAIDILRGDTAVPSADSEDADPTLPADWGVLGGLAVALTAYALLMKPAGFVIASSVLFVLAALSMGSRQLVRDLVIGIVVSFGTYLAFSEWLGIRLPQGILERFL
jgi:putative tricarboxylic transport membrane protein